MSDTKDEVQDLALNPVDPSTILKHDVTSDTIAKTVHPQQTPFEEDSAVTKAEKYERHGDTHDIDEIPTKRIKLDPSASLDPKDQAPLRSERRKGVAPVKAELVYLYHSENWFMTQIQIHRSSTW